MRVAAAMDRRIAGRTGGEPTETGEGRPARTRKKKGKTDPDDGAAGALVPAG